MSTLTDWQEILMGAEQDLAAAEERYTQAVADVGNAWERVVEDRAKVKQAWMVIGSLERAHRVGEILTAAQDDATTGVQG